MTDKTREAFLEQCRLLGATDEHIGHVRLGYEAATSEADAKYLPVIERLVENLKHIETAMLNAAKGAGGIEHEILSHTATYARESADLVKPLLGKREEV